MISFLVTYEVDPCQTAAIERYSAGWTALVQEHGGVHHGFHVAHGMPHEMIGFFSFESQAHYDGFRKAAVQDPLANALWDFASSSRSVRFRDRQVFHSIAHSLPSEAAKPTASTIAALVSNES